MVMEHEQRRSVWLAGAPATDYPAPDGNLDTDVAVVGGGICGLTTALMLRRSGLRVALLEARRIGCGVTGASTAKVTSLHGMKYVPIEEKFGPEAARLYAEANEAGLAQIASLAEELRGAGHDCRFERKAAYTCTWDAGRVDAIRAEADAARRAGLAASFVERIDVPFTVHGAVKVDNQGQLDPYRYCVGLAETCSEEGVAIFETSRVHDVRDEEGRQVLELHAQDLEVRANHVVVATLLPFLDRGGFFARAFPSRSYGIAVSLEGTAPDGMFINIDSPTRSIRSLPGGGMIVVGEQHKVGQEAATLQRYEALEEWARANFPVRSVDYTWSSQDYLSADELPYIGRMPTCAHVLTATGFGKWGLSMGTAAAVILKDLILDQENPWADVFNATRTDVLPSARKLIQENADVARRFVGDRLKSLAAPDAEELEPGEGAIARHGGTRVAAYRDEAGRLHTCSPVCTHMGCYLQWNAAERSWDCPCHGSRFDYGGSVLQGPAVNALESKSRR